MGDSAPALKPMHRSCCILQYRCSLKTQLQDDMTKTQPSNTCKCQSTYQTSIYNNWETFWCLLSGLEWDLSAVYRVASASGGPPRARFPPPLVPNFHKSISFLSLPQANSFQTKNTPTYHGTEQKIAIFPLPLLPTFTTFLSRIITKVGSDLE